MLVSVDDRVRDRFSDLVSRRQQPVAVGRPRRGSRRRIDAAVRYQSIENAPLLVFAAAGAVLVAFMLKT